MKEPDDKLVVMSDGPSLLVNLFLMEEFVFYRLLDHSMAIAF